MKVFTRPINNNSQQASNRRRHSKYWTFMPWLVWIPTGLFVLFQFCIQLSAGVMVKSWMHDFGISALSVGLLASSYYYIYVLLQTPAGILMDRFGPRRLLSAGALLCALGCLVFALTHSPVVASFARIAMGFGAAFAFVGSLYVIRVWFPAERYAMLVGGIETIGLLGTIAGNIVIADTVHHYGWRAFMIIAAMVAVVISSFVLLWVRDLPGGRRGRQAAMNFPKPRFFESLTTLLKGCDIWLNGIFNGLMFSIVTVFVSLWAIPFITTAYGVNLAVATAASSMVLVGAAIGSPVLGYVSDRIAKRKPILIIGSLLSVLFVSLVIYVPNLPLPLLFVLLLALGASASSYILCFSIANDVAAPGTHGCAIGFTNAMGVGTAPLLQPLIGWLLYALAKHPSHYVAADYRLALTVIPAALLVAALLACLLRETHPARQAASHSAANEVLDATVVPSSVAANISAVREAS